MCDIIETKIEKIANTPEKCFIYNEDLTSVSVPNELDKNYYIDLAKSRLNDFYSSEKKAAKKPKSEIKGINEDVYNDLLNLDQEEFDCFVDFLIFIKDNKLANKKQMEILTQLDLFSKFGNAKKLWKIVCEFYDGDLKYKPLKNETKLEELIESLRDFERELDNESFSITETISIRTKYLGFFITGKEEDRRILIVKRIQDARTKDKSRLFGKNISAVSLGSGKETWYTIVSKDYNLCGEIKENSVIQCINYYTKNGYFNIDNYKVLEF